ncbi:MAG: hypothetical protein NT131_02400 [Methanomassiliicoccales archaeon]|nr:hypothetical protein [Methanomassiliicoccales archaeon]
MKYDEITKIMVYKVLLAGLLLELMLFSIFSVEWGDAGNTLIDTATVGMAVFNDYGVAVLMLGLLLLSAILGGVFIAQEDDEE